ncbi:hypothetical protein [Pedobacter metabolipauper]|uniref:Uncharacterized protein n=1 Tax=Pedobacter metabolipauper TaxID=425513 RepID=A0A4R6T0C9_9SPHI|nr:hypothetical protein [Pedobacter metabolipauper]TDQ10275.1 hypothetical protein ATK78_2441 [Pedobacter metabolipauper]
MKKLIFAAALAIVAVGGALTSEATVVYPSGSNTPYDCAAGSTLCSTITPTPLYIVSFASGNQGKPNTLAPAGTENALYD